MGARKIVHIDEEKCNGCGECIPSCLEGALKIIDGKARLVSDKYCDGLGTCLGVCPQDAITIIERKSEDFEEGLVTAHQARERAHPPAEHWRGVHGSGCPGAALMDLSSEQDAGTSAGGDGRQSALSQWPVQLHLVPVDAPFFDGADLLLAADCVPFAFADFHGRLLRGRKLLVGCPKLDDAGAYEEKLAAILKRNDVRSLTVAHMEVPCCYGLLMLAENAVRLSGKGIPLHDITVTVRGQVLEGHEEGARHSGVALSAKREGS